MSSVVSFFFFSWGKKWGIKFQHETNQKENSGNCAKNKRKGNCTRTASTDQYSINGKCTLTCGDLHFTQTQIFLFSHISFFGIVLCLFSLFQEVLSSKLERDFFCLKHFYIYWYPDHYVKWRWTKYFRVPQTTNCF